MSDTRLSLASPLGTFEITKRSYAVDVHRDSFRDLMEEPLSRPTLCDKLHEIAGVDGVEYDGHFGANIFFTIDADEDTPQKHDEIRACIECHLKSIRGLGTRNYGK